MMELVDRGIPQERLGAEGYGNQLQAGGGAAAEGRQANRRIEVRVTQK
jgi:outer membrane protein OmpA-like peptidoglycan-associated protein